MSSFFNKVFGDSGGGDRKPETHLPRRIEGSLDSPFRAASSNSGDANADTSHQLFGQLADAEASKSSDPVSPTPSPSHQGDHSLSHGGHPQGFVRPDRLPVRGFTAGELAQLLPPEFINHQSLPAGQEVDLDLTRARQSLASGRPAVMLSDIYTACPRLFARPITMDQDFEVRLPARRVEALLGMADGSHAGGPASPFQLAQDVSRPAATQNPASSGQSPFNQLGATQAQPASPFEIVRGADQDPAPAQQVSVPLFSQAAPTPSEPAPAPVSSSAENIPDEHASPFSPAQSHQMNEPVKIQLGKALRFVSVEVLGFSARNVPESVISTISMAAIERRNPNGSATVPLSVLVNGLEPVYRSGFNQADMSASITIPADALPAVQMDAAPNPDSASAAPSSGAQHTTSQASVESPFAAFAREDAEKHKAGLRQNQAADTSHLAHGEGSGEPHTAEPARRAVSEDTRALHDLSNRLSAFREQTGEPAKPLEPLSGSSDPPVDPRSKFRDLQEQSTEPAEGNREPFIQTTPTPAPQPQAAFSNGGFDEDDDWKQVELKAVFGLEKTLIAPEVFDLMNQLDDVRSAAFLSNNETKFTTEGFDSVAPMLGGLIQSVRQLSHEIGIHGAQSFALQTNRGALAFFSEGIGTIAVMAKGEDISRASKQRIIVILRELVREF